MPETPAIEARQDISVTHIDLSNIKYRFIEYKQYAWWSQGYLGKKRRKPLPNCVIKKIFTVFEKKNYIFTCLTALHDFIMLHEIS